jgi:simple sugar transport system ATP-binding protein
VSAPAATPALDLRGIHKHFGSVHALRGVDFTIMPGELHALLGENGAGKSTLMLIAYGLVRPDRGEIRVGGVSRVIASPRLARQLGIGMVHQHFTSVPALTVGENVALAAGWPVSPGALARRVRAVSEGLGLPLDPDAITATLSVGLKQRLEIVKALATDTRILLLDEPTAVLPPAEVAELLRVVRAFTSAGGSAVLITHKLDEALAAADRVTVLRRGEVVFAGPVAGQTAASLASAMVGSTDVGASSGPASSGARPLGPPLVRGEAMEVAREDGVGIAVRAVSLAVHGGEIVGVAAVEGNGQRELLRAVAGRAHLLRGKLEVAGKVGFIPEDRTTEGLIPELTLTENVVLAARGDEPWIARGRIDWARARAYTRDLIEHYGIAAPGPDGPAGALSGGNQQKLIAARELAPSPTVVVAEDPTRGLDIRAAAAIHERLRAAAAGGGAVLLHSSDLDEVIECADRLLVMSRGILLEVPPGTSKATIGEMMVTGGR